MLCHLNRLIISPIVNPVKHHPDRSRNYSTFKHHPDFARNYSTFKHRPDCARNYSTFKYHPDRARNYSTFTAAQNVEYIAKWSHV